MTRKIVNSVKYLLVFSSLLFSVIACEKDFENIGVNIVDNNLFDTDFLDFDVVAYTTNIEQSEVSGDNPASPFIDGLPVFNIGILNDADFGTLKASFVSQVQRPNNGFNFGLNPVIDTVILDIPYFATRVENFEDGKPQFELDSIFGNQDVDYTLKVSRLLTFLNTLDPEDPTQNKRYFSDESYDKLEELHSASFKPNSNDTMLLVTRPFFTEPTDETKIDVDTIKREDLNPSIKLPFDKGLMNNIFIENPTVVDTASAEGFLNYFRGLIIEPQELSALGGSMMQLALNNASVNIYYTNEVLTDETETTGDLNGDGDTDDLAVPVKTKRTLLLPLSGIRSATYNRDYSFAAAELSNQFSFPDTINGHDKLFIQGASGSNTNLKLFKGVDNDSLNMLRQRDWLINGAVLDVYVENIADTVIPNRLYIYNFDNNSTVNDAISEAANFGVGGNLVRDDNGNPEKYTFFITDYISELLKENDFIDLSNLTIKTHHPTDNINALNDTIIRDFSWNPKGVVLKGNNIGENDDDFAKRLKLRIYYTEDPQ